MKTSTCQCVICTVIFYEHEIDGTGETVEGQEAGNEIEVTEEEKS